MARTKRLKHPIMHCEKSSEKKVESVKEYEMGKSGERCAVNNVVNIYDFPSTNTRKKQQLHSFNRTFRTKLVSVCRKKISTLSSSYF